MLAASARKSPCMTVCYPGSWKSGPGRAAAAVTSRQRPGPYRLSPVPGLCRPGLRLQLRRIADVEAEQQRTAGP